MNFRAFICLILFALALPPAYSCNQGGTTHAIKPAPQTARPAAKNIPDEELFRKFFIQFKVAAKQKNMPQLLSMFNYPVQTNPQWNNEDLRNSTANQADGLMKKPELQQYLDDIFTKDALRLIPRSTDNDLSEIDKTTPEDYYKRLSKYTDKGSTLYELNIEYAQHNGKETQFGFVFGKIGGGYKILSYYSPWPLK